MQRSCTFLFSTTLFASYVPQGSRYLDNVYNEMPMILSRIRKHQWQHLVEFGQLCQCLVDNYCLHVEASEVLSPQSVCRPIG